MKTILIHCLDFAPDRTSTAYIYNDIALKLKERGYNVKVLTTVPHHSVDETLAKDQPLSWKVWPILKKSEFRGIPVYHITQRKFKSTKMRILGFIHFHIWAFLVGLFIGKVDLILSPSPLLTVGALNICLKPFKRCKTIYNVQEIYPDLLPVKTGPVIAALKRLEKFVYNHSNAVTVIDEVFYNIVKPRFKNPEKLHIIPNFVDTDIYRPLSEYDINKAYFAHDERLRVVYAGNIGLAQDWDMIINVAARCKEQPVDFYIVGEGRMKSFVESKIQLHNLSNVKLVPYQPREKMPEILAYSDLQYIFMSHISCGDMGFPSKVYTIMACGKPLLVSSPATSPIVNFLQGESYAQVFTDPDIEACASQIASWLSTQTRETLAVMGAPAVEAIQKSYSKNVVTQQYADLISTLI